MQFSKKFISATRAYATLEKDVASPYLRRRFTVKGPLKNAELTVCALGFYRMWLDGTEITRGFLSPYITNPDKILDYDAYVLTDKLSKGEHVLAFQLGNGMQNSYGGYVWDFEKAPWRSAPKLALSLSMTAKDGTVTEIEADESFVCAPSPVTTDDLRQGEEYDARNEIEDWNTISFDDGKWTHALLAETPRGVAKLCAANPIVPTQELHPTILGKTTLRYEHSDVVDEGYLYDFGCNTAGICCLKVKGTRGQKISMIFGESVDENGTFSVDNIRFVRPEYYDLKLYIQKDVYICSGKGTETWEPSFTYHGFRYALVTGITEEQATEDLLTHIVMNTDLPERGGFSCSDEKLNRFQKMVRNSTLSNFYHFPTDCPQREKNGWTADAALSAEHTLLNLEPDNNYVEWLHHLCASMNNAGEIPGIVPTDDWGFAWGNGPAWDQILITLPYLLYRYRGTLEPAKTALPFLFRYCENLARKTDEKGLVHCGLGDWCAPYGPRAPLFFTDTVISMDICEKTAFLFEAIGQKAQAVFCRTLAEGFRKAVRENCIDYATMTVVAENTPYVGCESSQAMALYYNIFTEEERPKAYKVLLDKIAEQNGHLDVGVLGGRVIFHVLSAFSDTDLAYKILVEPSYPSYGMWLVNGETALAEKFSDDYRVTSSYNHHFWGDISNWFIADIGGIVLNPTAKDVHSVTIAPHLVSALDYAEAFHIAPDGKISVRWERRKDTVALTVTVPQGMHGTILFPDGYSLAENGTTQTALASGTYILKR